MGLHGKLITFKNVNNTLTGLSCQFINFFNVQERLNKPFGKNFKEGMSSIVKILFTEKSASDFYINLESLKNSWIKLVINFYRLYFDFLSNFVLSMQSKPILPLFWLLLPLVQSVHDEMMELINDLVDTLVIFVGVQEAVVALFKLAIDVLGVDIMLVIVMRLWTETETLWNRNNLWVHLLIIRLQNKNLFLFCSVKNLRISILVFSNFRWEPLILSDVVPHMPPLGLITFMKFLVLWGYTILIV